MVVVGIPVPTGPGTEVVVHMPPSGRPGSLGAVPGLDPVDAILLG
jgi:hypothetical protein